MPFCRTYFRKTYEKKYIFYRTKDEARKSANPKKIRRGCPDREKTGGRPPGDEVVRVKLLKKRNRELGYAELMMGANHIRIRRFDGVTRMGRIEGKIKKIVWIREGDVLIVIPWNFQDEKCDIVYRYTGPQVEWLRRNKYL